MTSVKTNFTYKDYLNIDDGKRYEIIHGELIMAPSPLTEHQRVSGKLEYKIRQYIEFHPIGEVLDAPLDVILWENEVFQPDIFFISTQNQAISQERGIFGAPDLVVEIVSKSSIQHDRRDKFDVYQRSGVKEYWIADPSVKSVEVFVLKEGVFTLHQSCTGEGKIFSIVLEGLVIDLKDIF